MAKIAATPGPGLGAQTQIVNIDAGINDLSNAVEVFLDAGTYSVTPAGISEGGAFNAWNAWGSTNCADTNGCTRTIPTTFTGWMNSYLVTSPNLANVSIGEIALTPVAVEPSIRMGNLFVASPATTYYWVEDFKVYPTDVAALVKSQTSRFTLAQAGTVGFGNGDNYIHDNVGGISLRVTLESDASAAFADLALSVSASPDPVIAGNLLTYTLSVVNQGPGTAGNVILTDTLPDNAIIIPPPNCSITGRKAACLLGDLPAGARAERSLTVQTAQVGRVANTASVLADQNDPNTANNSNVLSTTVTPPLPRGNLAIKVSATPNTVKLGKKLRYTLTAINRGRLRVNDVRILDTLPGGVTFLSAGRACSYDADSHAVTCRIDRLGARTRKAYKFTVAPTQTGSLSNTARITGPIDDTNPADNQATVRTRILAPPNNGISGIVDRDHGIRFNARPRGAELIVLTWEASPSVRSRATDYHFQVWVERYDDWQTFLGTDEPSSGNAPIVAKPPGSKFCLRMTGYVGNSANIIGSGTSGNAYPCR